MNKGKNVDKELHPRDPRLTVKQPSGELGPAQVNNISRTGALILTSNPLPIGSTVDLKFPIPGDRTIMLEGFGEVVRSQNEPAGMGVVFIMLTDSSYRDLNGLLARQVDTGARPEAR